MNMELAFRHVEAASDSWSSAGAQGEVAIRKNRVLQLCENYYLGEAASAAKPVIQAFWTRLGFRPRIDTLMWR